MTDPVWRTVAGKRAVRSFEERRLAPEHLARILDAGRRSGSSKNLQRWEFIVVEDRDRLRDLSTLGPWAGHLAGAAAGIALVTPDPRAPDAPLSIMFDLGQAAANMMLVAHELGLGSVPATIYEHDEARRLLGHPADRHCEYILSFGYPADPADLSRPPRSGRRKPLEELVHRETW